WLTETMRTSPSIGTIPAASSARSRASWADARPADAPSTSTSANAIGAARIRGPRSSPRHGGRIVHLVRDRVEIPEGTFSDLELGAVANDRVRPEHLPVVLNDQLVVVGVAFRIPGGSRPAEVDHQVPIVGIHATTDRVAGDLRSRV